MAGLLTKGDWCGEVVLVDSVVYGRGDGGGRFGFGLCWSLNGVNLT